MCCGVYKKTRRFYRMYIPNRSPKYLGILFDNIRVKSKWTSIKYVNCKKIKHPSVNTTKNSHPILWKCSEAYKYLRESASDPLILRVGSINPLSIYSPRNISFVSDKWLTVIGYQTDMTSRQREWMSFRYRVGITVCVPRWLPCGINLIFLEDNSLKTSKLTTFKSPM